MSLILTRNIGETVVLYNEVHCTILDVQGTQVRLRWDAPRRIVINRLELHNRIMKKQSNDTRTKREFDLNDSAFTLPETQLILQDNGHITH